MATDRREFLKASFGNALKLAGLGTVAGLAGVDRMRGQSQDDEDGYQVALERWKQLDLGGDKEVLPLGKPAPNWLRNAEVYSGFYDPWSENVLETWLKDFPLIIGVPHVRSWPERAHQLGIRVTPYVSFYKSLNLQLVQKLGVKKGVGEFNTLPSPFISELDLSQHPEWILYDKEGKPRRPFADPNYPPAWLEVCTAAPGYAEAALKGIQALMKLGMDGLFIDNAHPTPHCYGPAFGRHTHVNGLDNGEAYKRLLGSVYALVKKFSPDNITLLNAGYVEPRYWPYADAMMFESYMGDDLPWFHAIHREGYTTSRNWETFLRRAKNCQRAIQDRKAVVALSYFAPDIVSFQAIYGVGESSSKKIPVHPTNKEDFLSAEIRAAQELAKWPPRPPKMEDVFYSYACARISGFLWSDFFSLPPHHPAQKLYKLRLGRVVAKMEEINGIYLLRFQRGLVVVNPLAERKRVQIQLRGMPNLSDVFNQKVVEVSGDRLPVDIPGQSGRVFCSGTT